MFIVTDVTTGERWQFNNDQKGALQLTIFMARNGLEKFRYAGQAPAELKSKLANQKEKSLLG
jgi:hypothetical protein